MVMTPEIQKVLAHSWLRHQDDRLFHAYISPRSGAESLCGGVPPIHDMREMDIPGARSRCCGNCFTALYGIDLKDPNSKDRP